MSSRGGNILRLPVPSNPFPEPLSYEQARVILQTFADDLQRAEATLASMDSGEFRLPLDITQIHFDVNRDGNSDQSLWDVFRHINRRAQLAQSPHQACVVFFDRSDAYWLQGYCHLLTAAVEMVLAYDASELFDRSAHLFFPKVVKNWA